MNIKPVLDVIRGFSRALLDTLRAPRSLPQRSWTTELMFRFIKGLLEASKGQSIPWLRQRQNLLKLYTPAYSRVVFESTTLVGVAVQWCRPKRLSQRRAIVIYFHGGGYVIGSVNGYHNTLAALSIASDCAVLGVDYRLGPEHPFPAAHDDCLAVCRHLLENDPDTHVILAGDSAGGALALACHLALAKDGDSPLPCALALISPWVDPGAKHGSMLANAGTDFLDLEITTSWLSHYLAGASPDNARVNFTRQDLSSLPPTYIQAAGAEILLDQIQAFAERAQQSGVALTLDIYAGQFHVFQTFSPFVGNSSAAIVKLGEFIVRRSTQAI
jgi:acetyl esterase/lipase